MPVGRWRDAHRGLDLVHVLAAFAAGPVGVHLEFDGRDHDFRGGLLDFGNRIHAGETGVAAFVGVEGRDAHQAVDAALGLAVAVGVFARDQHRGALDAGGFARQRVGDIDLPAARLGPALVHAQEHARPIARFGAARARVDAQDAVALVVRAVEEYLQLQGVQLLEEPGQVPLEFLSRFWPGPVPARPAQLDHHAEIVELLFRLEQRLDLVAEGVGLVDELLGLLAIVPELLRRHQGVDFAQAFLRAGTSKKPPQVRQLVGGRGQFGCDSLEHNRM